jgi:hypothetical protein
MVEQRIMPLFSSPVYVSITRVQAFRRLLLRREQAGKGSDSWPVDDNDQIMAEELWVGRANLFIPVMDTFQVACQSPLSVLHGVCDCEDPRIRPHPFTASANYQAHI